MALEYSETDPSGRYGRFREILGKGSMKIVYKAFDEVLGMEVAWNQVKFVNIFETPDQLKSTHSEIDLLKNLDHDSILKCHASWVDADHGTLNFITELCTSGTLREYRQTYKSVHIGAIKNWARQILQGLVYLHGLNPPVIHRDLKCDNIFINGHLGQVKIGDLGLAAILSGSHRAHRIVGTTEFMAPEMFKEDYDELVDIYAFGMCALEILTSEYPYNECSGRVEVYKKVTSGKLPDAFYRIEDVEAKRFVRKCFEPASRRVSAQELLMDPFLTIAAAAADDDDDEKEEDDEYKDNKDEEEPITPISRAPSHDYLTLPAKRIDMTISGTLNPDDNKISLILKITDYDAGTTKKVDFQFDTRSDTAMEIAIEMVKETEIKEIREREPSEIAQIIDEEISSLVPTWNHQYRHQQSFNYGDHDYEDEDGIITARTHNPFYSLSSHSISSSQASLHNPSSGAHNHSTVLTTSDHDEWCLHHQEGGCILEEDARSESSSSLNSSYNYSNVKYYYSGHEMDSEASSSSTRGGGYPQLAYSKSTRFSPQEEITNSISSELLHAHNNNNRGHPPPPPPPPRVMSLVDMRSQMLRQRLQAEERLFKTVGAVEGIGYQLPNK